MSRVYVVGGAGYVGTPLVKLLRDWLYDVEVVDLGIFGNVPPEECRNVLNMSPPLDSDPVVWLASQHKEPVMTALRRGAWEHYAFMVESAIKRWSVDRPCIFVSSMQVVTHPDTLYAQHKRSVESLLLKGAENHIIRSGTVFGGLENDPTRPQTIPNRVILGRGEYLPDENYCAYWTGLDQLVLHLGYTVDDAHEPCYMFKNEVENVLYRSEPFDRELIRAWIDRVDSPFKGLQVTVERTAELAQQEHPTVLLARAAGLPI